MTMAAAITGTQALSRSKIKLITLLITWNSIATTASEINMSLMAVMIRTACPYKSPIASATERLSKNSPIRIAS